MKHYQLKRHKNNLESRENTNKQNMISIKITNNYIQTIAKKIVELVVTSDF